MEEKKTVIRQATLDDLDGILELIKLRIRWMDEVGIEQWNKTDYPHRYPRDYYIRNISSFFVMYEGDEMIGEAAFYRKDGRWPDEDEVSAICIHHLASRIGHPGTAEKMVRFAEQYAREHGIERVRLDSAKGNRKLADLYTGFGYTEKDELVEGAYVGIRREKIVLPE